MATQSARISVIFAQAQTASLEVQDAIQAAMGYVAYSQGASLFTSARQSANEALEMTQELLDRVRALCSALEPR